MMLTVSRAVFLSYASEDAPAAQRIAEALRSAGIEVWFDREELRGGDAWDQKIRQQIRDCRLFVPIISAHSEARLEGYFRREWKLACDRTDDMASEVAFLVPVVIDDTANASAHVPERFRHVQWTRLVGGQTSPAFTDRVKQLLSPDPSRSPTPARLAEGSLARPPPTQERPSPALRRRAAFFAVATVAVVALGYLAFEQLVRSRPSGRSVAATNSIAVLPLANESGDASQQYFSDGISEDLITTLSQLPSFKVIGRTSSFRFRDSKDDSKTIGAKLGVAHLLEGSVRKAGDMVRVSAELIDTSDGSTQWSERYDRPYKDLFALQDDITRAVAGALKAHLLSGENPARQSDRPPSGNLEAYNALLEGNFYYSRDNEADYRKAIERFTFAAKLDPRYALAWSYVSRAWGTLGWNYLDLAADRDAYAKARAAAETALGLAPNLASAHLARGRVLYEADFDWRGAEAEFRRALVLAPADSDAKANLAYMLATLGQTEGALKLNREALASDPLNASWYLILANHLLGLDRLEEAQGAIRRAIELQPTAQFYHAVLTMIEIKRGDAQAALAAAQQEPPGFYRDSAIAKALQIGGNHPAADAALKNVIDRDAGSVPYDVAQIYAIRNDADKTFEWLDRAFSERDPGVAILLYDPFILRYRRDLRFAAFCRKAGLPVPGESSGA
jgi:TolB-like protein/Flp pilus assembly protein TadD